MKRNVFIRFSGPSNIIMFFLMIIPLGVALFLSLQFVTFRNLSDPQFVGLANYI